MQIVPCRPGRQAVTGSLSNAGWILVKLIVLGNSHINSINSAGPVAREAGLEPRFMRSSAHVEDRPDGSKALKAGTADFLRREPGPVFSMIGGNGHNVFGLVYPRKPFDFYHPDYPDRQPGPSWIIPYEQVWDSVMRHSVTRLKELRALVAACPGRVIHLESPPPIPSQSWLTEKLAPRMEAAGLKDYEVAAPSVRFKLWRVSSAIFGEECARLGVPFLPAPAEASDDKGFLRRRYWRDPTHANSHYGALLIRQMMEHLDVAPV